MFFMLPSLEGIMNEKEYQTSSPSGVEPSSFQPMCSRSWAQSL
jgi:hypothetical protein